MTEALEPDFDERDYGFDDEPFCSLSEHYFEDRPGFLCLEKSFLESMESTSPFLGTLVAHPGAGKSSTMRHLVRKHKPKYGGIFHKNKSNLRSEHVRWNEIVEHMPDGGLCVLDEAHALNPEFFCELGSFFKSPTMNISVWLTGVPGLNSILAMNLLHKHIDSSHTFNLLNKKLCKQIIDAEFRNQNIKVGDVMSGDALDLLAVGCGGSIREIRSILRWAMGIANGRRMSESDMSKAVEQLMASKKT